MVKIKRKINIVSFICIFLCAYLLAEGFMVTQRRRNMIAEEKNYEAMCMKSTDDITQLFGQLLRYGTQVSTLIFKDSWFDHLRNYVGYYNGEFDAIAKDNIIKEIQREAATLSYVYDLLIAVPSCDTVICKNGWFRLKDYEKMYGDAKFIVSQDGSYATTIESEKPVIVVADPSVRKYPAFAVIVVDQNAFRTAFMRATRSEVSYICADLDGKNIFSSGSNEDLLTYTSEHNYTKLKITLGYQTPNMSAENIAFIASSAFLLALFLLIALASSRYFLKPLHKLVADVGGSKRDYSSPYEYVGKYIGTLHEKEKELKAEIVKQESDLSRFMSRARVNIMRDVLLTEYFDFQDRDVAIAFPWLDDAMMMCMFASAGNGVSVSELETLHCVEHSVTVDMGEERYVVVWLWKEASMEEAEAFCDSLRLAWERAGKRKCLRTGVFSGAKYLHGMYAELSTNLRMVSKTRTALPREMCMRVAELAQNSETEELIELAQSLSGYYEPEDILRPAAKAAETEMDVVPESWDEAYALLRQMTEQNSPATPDDAEELLVYIEQNYTDPDLSVNMLAEKFSKHRTIVSKQIKAATGETFTEYLRNKRMEEALKKLDQGETNVMQVASEVGYVSYSTFKRAFMQKTGVTPMEYKGQHDS